MKYNVKIAPEKRKDIAKVFSEKCKYKSNLTSTAKTLSYKKLYQKMGGK